MPTVRTSAGPGWSRPSSAGLAFGGIYAWRRQISFVMILHAAFDLTAIALIYWNWEATVAHLLFR